MIAAKFDPLASRRLMLTVPATCCAAGAQGWAWVDEGKNGQAKWGWVSDKPGSKLLFKVSLPTD